MKMPLIFDIKRTSTTDGPGIRTVVFFKGCNLDCYWCHNPEGKSPRAELAFFKEKCIGCRECGKTCTHTKETCTACGQCAAHCPTGAKKLYGQTLTADELLNVIQKDAFYYRATGGGVTFSGGECMLYPEFLAQLAGQCRANGIPVAIDTAGCVPWENFEKVLPHADLFLYDIKALDPTLHRTGTGKENTLILQNLERLLRAGMHIIVRTPVVPGFNDGEELAAIQAYCRERGLPLETLAYHTFGESKKEALQTF